MYVCCAPLPQPFPQVFILESFINLSGSVTIGNATTAPRANFELALNNFLLTLKSSNVGTFNPFLLQGLLNFIIQKTILVRAGCGVRRWRWRALHRHAWHWRRARARGRRGCSLRHDTGTRAGGRGFCSLHRDL